MSTLLTYAITPSPQPLQASPQTGSQLIGQLTVVATNSGQNPVTINWLQVSIPVGTEANDLTDSTIGFGTNLPAGWQPGPPIQSEGIYTFVFSAPSGGASVAGNGGDLIFTINNIPLVNQPGSPVITVTEGSAGNPGYSQTLTLYPNGFSTIQFNVTPTNLVSGASVVLNWVGPSGATYTIQYALPGGTLVNLPALGSPAFGSTGTYPGQGAPPLTLLQTTVFTLTVTQIINKVAFTLQPQQTATVLGATPVINSFTGNCDANGLVNFMWQTTNTAGPDSVQTNFSNETASNPNVPVYPTPEVPYGTVLNNQFSITAVNGVVSVSASCSWTMNQVYLGFSSPWSQQAMSNCHLSNGNVFLLYADWSYDTQSGIVLDTTNNQINYLFTTYQNNNIDWYDPNNGGFSGQTITPSLYAVSAGDYIYIACCEAQVKTFNPIQPYITYANYMNTAAPGTGPSLTLSNYQIPEANANPAYLSYTILADLGPQNPTSFSLLAIYNSSNNAQNSCAVWQSTVQVDANGVPSAGATVNQFVINTGSNLNVLPLVNISVGSGNGVTVDIANSPVTYTLDGNILLVSASDNNIYVCDPSYSTTSPRFVINNAIANAPAISGAVVSDFLPGTSNSYNVFTFVSDFLYTSSSAPAPSVCVYPVSNNAVGTPSFITFNDANAIVGISQIVISPDGYLLVVFAQNSGNVYVGGQLVPFNNFIYVYNAFTLDLLVCFPTNTEGSSAVLFDSYSVSLVNGVYTIIMANSICQSKFELAYQYSAS